MANQIFTATGCARCKITKSYMKEHNISYDEFDIKTDGKDAFAKFYRENRNQVYRDNDGVEFPVFVDGNVIQQGVSPIIGYLCAKDKLNGFISRSQLHGEWIDGFDISGGNPVGVDELIAVLSHLQKNGLKIQLTGNGKNALVMEKLLTNKIGDRFIMKVLGPEDCYSRILGEKISSEELTRSISLATQFPECHFITEIRPVVRQDSSVSFLRPEEVGNTAKMIEVATGSKNNSYLLAPCSAEIFADDLFRGLESLPETAMFKYRTAARRFQVMTEIQKKKE
ncbi:MAG: glutaredoxin family protein [Desulforhopalus sp.]